MPFSFYISIARTIKPETQPPEPVMEYNNKTYQSYVDNGFIDRDDITIPHSVLAPEKRKREFLSRVDVSKGEIERKVTTIVRLKAKDYSTKSNEKKEYIIYYEEWFGKNWLG